MLLGGVGSTVLSGGSARAIVGSASLDLRGRVENLQRRRTRVRIRLAIFRFSLCDPEISLIYASNWSMQEVCRFSLSSGFLLPIRANRASIFSKQVGEKLASEKQEIMENFEKGQMKTPAFPLLEILVSREIMKISHNTTLCSTK